METSTPQEILTQLRDTDAISAEAAWRLLLSTCVKYYLPLKLTYNSGTVAAQSSDTAPKNQGWQVEVDSRYYAENGRRIYFSEKDSAIFAGLALLRIAVEVNIRHMEETSGDVADIENAE